MTGEQMIQIPRETLERVIAQLEANCQLGNAGANGLILDELYTLRDEQDVLTRRNSDNDFE